MKVTDLMVGDWVYVSGKPVKITKDDLATMLIFLDDDSKIDPITLTEDILVKNRFQKLNDKTFLLKNQIEIEVGTKFSEVSARYEDYDRDYNSYNNRYIEIAIIHYVHELQHLLPPCGIEKEITL
jgi:hypothetical protein